MSTQVELKENCYYLVDKSGLRLEIKCERVTQTSYFLKIFYPNNKETPYLYEWISKYNVVSGFSTSSKDMSVLEELDPKYYRKQKLERITESETEYKPSHS